MSSSSHFDVVVLGAGIAGLSIADALLQNRCSVAIADISHPGAGASGAPLMMINPAAGRRAKMSWRAAECLESVTDMLSRTQAVTDRVIFESGGILRPALYPEIAADFERSPKKYSWPDGWIEWQSEERFSSNHPAFGNHCGGLIIKKGITVKGTFFIDSLSKMLLNNGLSVFYNLDYRLEKEDSSWSISFSDGQEIKSEKVVFATGRGLTSSRHWSFLNPHLIKGQTATFLFKKPIPLKCSVSSLGYMAYMSSMPNQITVGSTYEHHFDYAEPDEKGLKYLIEKLQKTLPSLLDQIVSSDQWASFRVTVQDKQPVIGPHPDHPNLYVIGALGSKGMLMGRYLAETLARHILSGEKIERAISTERFFSDSV